MLQCIQPVILTSKLNGSSVTTIQPSRVVHLTAVDTKIGFCQDTDSQHAASFTESDGVIVYPSVSVAAHWVTSGDSAGEGGGVPHRNSRDLHFWWHCSGGTSDTMLHYTMGEYYSIRYRLLACSNNMTKHHNNVCLNYIMLQKQSYLLPCTCTEMVALFVLSPALFELRPTHVYSPSCAG